MLTLTPAAAGKVKELLVEEGRADIALRTWMTRSPTRTRAKSSTASAS